MCCYVVISVMESNSPNLVLFYTRERNFKKVNNKKLENMRGMEKSPPYALLLFLNTVKIVNMGLGL